MSLRTLVLGSVVGMVIAVPASYAKDHRVVLNDDMAAAAQNYLQDQGVLEKGANMNAKMTRGAFISNVVQLVYKKDMNVACFEELGSYPEQEYTLLFKDVKKDSAMGLPLCVALSNGLANGRPDGNFHPEAPIKTAEAAWIVYKAYDLGPLDRKNLPGAPWYSQKLYDVNKRGVLDPSVLSPSHELTVAESAAMFLELREQQMRLQNAVLRSTQFNSPTRLLGNDEPKSEIQARTLSSQEGVIPGVTRVRARGKEYVVPRRTRR